MFYDATGRPTFPDLAMNAAIRERSDLLRTQVDLSIADIDTRLAALKLLYGRPNHQRHPVEIREASEATVDSTRRIITVIAVPYESPAQVQYRQEWWQEIFARHAFHGIDADPNQVRVNRDHDRTRTVGKVVRFDPNHPTGLLAEIRIAETQLGDETLALAAEDMLSASVGFGVYPGGHDLDRRTMTRRINRAFLNHLSLVEQPAYDGAKVVGVA